MTNIKNGGLPAMPCTKIARTGMTKREMMAMHIMSGLVSDPNVDAKASFIAQAAVKAADALLAELERTK